MIQLGKKPEVPATLKSQKVEKSLKAVAQKSQSGTLSSGDFKSHWLADDVRLTLWKYQNRKCCYCERLREARREPDIEHFRPKAPAPDRRHEGYWWLAYQWENLFFSCKACNQEFKASHFPLRRGGKRARSRTDRLERERALLFDLVRENPEDYILYEFARGPLPLAQPRGRDREGRGQRVIELLGLDRPMLNEERGSLIPLLDGLVAKVQVARAQLGNDVVERVETEVRDAANPRQSFLGFRRYFFKQMGVGGCLDPGS